jgi:hypothetical protein
VTCHVQHQLKVCNEMDSFFTHTLERDPCLVFGIFFSSYFTVCEMPENQAITFEGIYDVIQLDSELLTQLTKEEIMAYGGILYEAILMTKYDVSKGPYLCIKPEIPQNIETYFHNIVRVIEERKANCSQNVKEIESYLYAFCNKLFNKSCNKGLLF